MQTKLTKRAVDTAKPGPKDLFLWDTELKGFGCKVTPAAKRVFIVQYWAPQLQRVRRRMTLGVHGPLTVDQARAAAQRILGRVASGEDPAAELASGRQRAKEQTVQLASEAYLAEARKRMSATTAGEYDRMFRKVVLPAFGKKPVAQVAYSDIADLHLRYSEHHAAGNNLLTMLKSFFNWAEKRGYRPKLSNPCADVEPYPKREVERFLSPDEVARLGEALVTAETIGLPPAPQHRKRTKSPAKEKHRPKKWDAPIPADPIAVAAIRFLLLTGWRKQEALTLRWAVVDQLRASAVLPKTKTGKSARPLGTAALELLDSLPRVEGSPFVFPGAQRTLPNGELAPPAPLKDVRRLWAAVRHATKLEDVRLHDLRHTLASFAVGSGYSLFITGKLLGHSQAGSTQRYAHLADDVRKEAADTVSGVLAAALKGQGTPVTPLRKAEGQ